MTIRLRSLIVSLSLFVQTVTFASQTGIMLSYPVQDQDPSDLHGLRGSVWYEPTTFVWGNSHLLFDASYGHWWVNNYPTNREINIIAVAPVYRYYFFGEKYSVSPFLDVSIGGSYVSETRFADRNLGMHFSFQDQLGLGASFGPQHHLFASIYAVHYSNGSLCNMNAGITIPIVANVGYRF